MAHAYSNRDEGLFLLSVFVRADEVESGNYDQIEVWKSTFGLSGPFEEVTGDGYQPARTPHTYTLTNSPAGPDRELAGLTLQVKANGGQLFSYTFQGVNPFSPTQLADEIANSPFGTYLRANFTTVGEFVLETTNTGLASAFEVVDGTALNALKLRKGKYRGLEPRMEIYDAPMEAYLQDPSNVATDIYKVRLRNSTDDVVGPWSEPIRSDDIRTLPPSQLIRARVKLVTLEGRPKADTVISVTYAHKIQLINYSTLLVGNAVRMTTDRNGEAVCTLLRDVDVDVLVDGTSLAQRVHTIADASVLEMDLFDPALAKDDGMAVQRPGLPFSARRL